jgi:TonB family protein
MMAFTMRFVLTVVALALIALSGIASGTDNKSAGKELIDRGRKLSDIRVDGAPAFHLEGTFEITPKDGGEKTRGTLSEIWLSNRQWRREVQTVDFHRIQIRHNAARWLADSGSNHPEPALYGPLTLLFQSDVPDLEVSDISERQLNSGKVTCVESGLGWTKDTDCIDPDTGAFLRRDESFDAFDGGRNAVRHSCLYSNYEKFGDRIFPKRVRCTSDPGADIELTVTKLVVESSSDPSLFVRPPGAIEKFACEKTTPPKAISSPAPQYPPHQKGRATVMVSTLVGEDGIPKDLQVVRSAGHDFDQAALNAARQWRFKPPTCDSSPIQARINIEIVFNLYKW